MQACRDFIDAAIAQDRFSGARLRAALIPELRASDEVGGAFKVVWDELNEATAMHTVMGMVRAVFLFEPVNEAVTSTKFERRWASRLASDPRGCSFEQCWTIFEELSEQLATRAGDVRDLLGRFHPFAALPYEVPIDYLERAGHTPGNMGWIWDDPEIEHTLLLRERVSDEDIVGPLTRAFDLAGRKTGVKTYLTDRALTGAHKTNREKRWEAHPEGVQFAFRRDCLKIEHKLLSQLCYFEGFPDETRERLSAESAILDLELPARCPITRDPLDFDVLVASLEAPEAGRSAFQVGHLNPLKGPGSGPQFGHTPANVAWISEDGNRIQGHLSYDETVTLLERIAENYQAVGPPPEAN